MVLVLCLSSHSHSPFEPTGSSSSNLELELKPQSSDIIHKNEQLLQQRPYWFLHSLIYMGIRKQQFFLVPMTVKLREIQANQ